MKLDENYRIEASENQWTLIYEKSFFNEKTKKNSVSTAHYYHSTLNSALASYIDKKLKDEESVDDAIKILKSLLQEVELLKNKTK